MLNDAGLFIAECPTWWMPRTEDPRFAQTLKATDYFLTMISPEAYKKSPINGLLVYGPPGTGKTSAALGVLYEWGRQGHTASMQDFGELMVRVRSSWRKDAAFTTEQIHAALLAPKILLLDDVAKRAAPEDQETLSTVVNSRINRSLPTICTTNCDLGTQAGRDEFLRGADSRVLERYSQYEVEAKGDNLRRKL